MEKYEKKDKRLQITDEEALVELNRFREEIDKVILKTRYQFWMIQYILLIAAITGVYLSSFPFDKESFDEKMPKVLR